MAKSFVSSGKSSAPRVKKKLTWSDGSEKVPKVGGPSYKQILKEYRAEQAKKNIHKPFPILPGNIPKSNPPRYRR